MKTKFSVVAVVTALTLVFTVSVAMAAPSVGDSGSSVATSTNQLRATMGRITPMSGGVGTITLTPVLGPAPLSPSFQAFAAKVVADAKNHAVNMVSHTVVNPTDYTVCNGKIDWYNLVFSTSTPLWNDILNPTSPFQGEIGHIVLQLVQAKSSGGDSISLSMIKVSGDSSDGGILRGSLTFEGKAYGPLAIGIKADGTVISSGSDDQLVSEVIFVTYMKLFNGGGTQAGLNEDRQWITVDNSNYAVTYSAEFIGSPETKVSAVVSLNGYSNAQPIIQITSNSISLANNEAGRVYTVLTATDINGPWSSFGSITDRQVLPIASNEPKRFFWVKTQ